MRFKPGDKVVYTGNDYSAKERLKEYKKPYLTVEGYKPYDEWMTFKDEPMRYTKDPSIYPNGWHDYHFEPYEAPMSLDDDLFTL